MPLVSLIMPAKLESDEDVGWMKEQLETILTQDQESWELLVVNDHSGQSFKPLADFFRDDRISGMKASGYGPAAARNQAAEASTSGLLLPVDHDDKVAPGALKLLLGGWGECGNGVIYGDTVIFGENGSRVFQSPPFDPDLMLKQLLMPVFGLHSKAAWQDAGGWKSQLEHGLEDWEYYLSLMEKGHCGHHVKGVTYYYRKHTGSRLSNLLATDTGYQVAYSRMRDMHSDLFAGRIKVPCGPCSGQIVGNNKPIQPQSSVMTAVQMSQVPADQLVRVEYTGRRAGSFTITGRPSMAQYDVSGPGSELVGVDGRPGVLGQDIRFITSLDGGNTFRVVQ